MTYCRTLGIVALGHITPSTRSDISLVIHLSRCATRPCRALAAARGRGARGVERANLAPLLPCGCADYIRFPNAEAEPLGSRIFNSAAESRMIRDGKKHQPASSMMMIINKKTSIAIKPRAANARASTPQVLYAIHPVATPQVDHSHPQIAVTEMNCELTWESTDSFLHSSVPVLLCVRTATSMAEHDDNVPVTTFLSLPEELLLSVTRLTLAGSLPTAVCLATLTCRGLSKVLRPILVDAAERRLQWLPMLTMRHKISDTGRTLVKTHANGHDCACAAGPLLPTVGRTAWRVRVEESCADEDDPSSIYIGICDAAGRSEWGLDLREGILIHLKRNHKGQIVELGDHRADRAWLGDAVCLGARAAGAVVQVIVDHDVGTVSFKVDNGPATAPAFISSAVADLVAERDGRRGGGQVEEAPARESLAQGASLRPYASLGLARSARPDRVSFCDGYVYTP